MRSFFRDHWKAVGAIVLLVVLAAFVVHPGAAVAEPALAMRLRAHVDALAPAAAPAPAGNAARYIAAALRGEGYVVRRAAGKRDAGAIEAALSNLAPGARPQRIFVIGARYGDAADAAGDASAAAVLELARLLKGLRPSRGTEIRFAFFDGAARPERGSFLAFIGAPAASRTVQQALAGFQGGADGPARGLAAPAFVQGETLSADDENAGNAGHSTRAFGAPAVMVTSTTFMRYPYYGAGAGADHAAPASDGAGAAAGRYDFAGVARVLTGLAHTIEALAATHQG